MADLPAVSPELSFNEGKESIKYYSWPHDQAMQTLLPILLPHRPYSNPLFNRMKAPHNLPSRHCLFAATFPQGTSTIPDVYTILFADRSRHEESQIWSFNSLNSINEPLTTSQKDTLALHMNVAIYFFKGCLIPEAPGWPFSPVLKFACLHEQLSSTLLEIGQRRDAVRRNTSWNCWVVDTSTVSSLPASGKKLPEGYSITRVPEDQLGIVISTSSIPRQPSTYKLLPSVGALDASGSLVAWGYVGIDSSFATLYVLPDFRGKGLSSIIGRELLTRLNRGDFSDMGYDGKSGWVHADVYAGNRGSEAVMQSLGGHIAWKSSYVWIDSDKF